MPRLAAVVLALVAWFTPTPAQGSASSDYEYGIHVAVNNARQVAHAPRVRHGSCVDKHAEQWARHLADQGRLVHRDQRVIAKACNGVMAGEVIASGFTLPALVVGAWLLSPTHNRVTLNDGYRRIGIGAVRDTHGRWYVVANFLRH